jgi:hypothetical protein
VNTKPTALRLRHARVQASAKIAPFNTAKYPNRWIGSPPVATSIGDRNPPAIASAASGCESLRTASQTVSPDTSTSSAIAGNSGSTPYSRNAANVVR